MDYQIQPNSRRCTATGRELRPGERYFSVLLEVNHHLVRQDFSCEAWQGPPPGTYSFWTGRVPAADEKRRPPIDDELLVECLERLEGQTDQEKMQFRYVIALLLIRRKRLRLEEVATREGRETLVMRCPRSRQKYEVPNPGLTPERMTAVQDEVFRVLGWE